MMGLPAKEFGQLCCMERGGGEGIQLLFRSGFYYLVGFLLEYFQDVDHLSVAQEVPLLYC